MSFQSKTKDPKSNDEIDKNKAIKEVLVSQELEEFNSNEILRMLTDNLPDMLWIKDKEGKYLFANKAICDNLLMATSTDEPINKNDVFFALREREAHKDKKDWHTFGELCSDSDFIVMQNNKPMRFEEYGNVKGEFLYLEVHKAPFYDKSGNIIGTVGSGRDITQQMLLKKELEELNKNLELRIKEAVKEVKEKDSYIIQQSRLAQMGEMIGMIAHQWRQPLTAISSASATIKLKSTLNTLNQDTIIDLSTKISDYSQMLSVTIDDFRNFFKTNKMKNETTCNKLINETLSIVSVAIENKNIKLVTNADCNTSIVTFENEVKQVLLNLIQNAEDALLEKDIKNPTITISALNKNIFVSDNAGGIADNIMEKIFDPYFSTKREKDGTGLGLYMSKTIIEEHCGGKLTARNSKDGAVFNISL